jgi:hypothetical protein
MNTRVAVIALVVCAISDLAAVPLIVGSDDAPAGVGVTVAALGVITLVAAYGVGTRTRWGSPVGIGTRIIDILAAIPVLGDAVGAEKVAASVTIVLSLVTIGLLLRQRSAQPV